MNTIEEIASVLKQCSSAVIFTHTRPDGDTLGSGMALSRALSLLKKKCTVVNDGEIPAKLNFLAGMGEIVRTVPAGADLYLCVDVSDVSRLGGLEESYRRGARRAVTVNIDHHVSNTLFARYNYVSDRPSNCENILLLLRALGVEAKGEIADFLLLGMVTDSGTFTHRGVKGDTLRAAADAMDGGADLYRVAYETCIRRSKGSASLYAEVLSRLRYLLGDKLAVASVSREQLARYGLKSDATEGIVDFGLGVDGVEVSACLLETGERQYKVSLRSKGKVDVNGVARVFGGGGHVLASGCMLFGAYEDVLDRLRYAVWQHMEEA